MLFSGLIVLSFLFVMSRPLSAEAPTLSVELNKLEPAENACRAYLVLSNKTEEFFEGLKLDLVMFDADGIVANRLAVEGAPLRPGKTSLKVFDIGGSRCDGIGSILLNEVITCQTVSGQLQDCWSLLQVSARGGVTFLK